MVNRIGILLCLAISVSGCATHWVNASGQPATARDLYECEREATFGTRVRDYDPLLRNKCLRARGYEVEFK